jgi:hypothetical protein
MASPDGHPHGALTLRFRIEPDGVEIETQPEIVVVAGYTSRDREAVLDHIVELERLGIAPPPSVPSFYAVSPQLLSQGAALVTTEIATSGEAEACLIVDHGEMYVTVCSDHTDRAAERFDIAVSKRACHKVIGSFAWRLSEVLGRWDELELRSWIGEDADVAYQDAPLRALVPPLELLDAIPWSSEPASAFLLLCGTLPALPGIQPSPRFRAELHDPPTGGRLTIDYAVEARDLLRTAPEDDPTLEPIHSA